MSTLIRYFDARGATIAVLRDYRDQTWKRERSAQRLAQLDGQLQAPRGANTEAVHGGGSRFEEGLCAAIDKKTVLEECHQVAVEYCAEFEPCWQRLSEEERALLTLRYIDYNEGQGIRQIMERYNLSQAEAYRKSNKALKRLTGLLFYFR